MTDRYRGRLPASNPDRSSLGYGGPIYAADPPFAPSPSSRHYVTTPRTCSTTTNSSGVPTTTRTYAVGPDLRPRSATRDPSRTRRSTTDSTHRPSVIITTTTTSSSSSSSKKDRLVSASPRLSSLTRPGSPGRERDAYRSSDGPFYAQPASSSRSRTGARPSYHAASSSDDYGRIWDRGDAVLPPRDPAPYRGPHRPSIFYPADPRHGSAPIDYGDDGYQYTNAGELVRYDLDHTQPTRPRRHDSLDRAYYRSSPSYSSDPRAFNYLYPGHDIGRNYSSNTSRPYDARGGPPPSTRGFDKINSRPHEAPRDMPPSPAASSSHPDYGGFSADGWETATRNRPLSLHQDGAPFRFSTHGDFSRLRDGERSARDFRDRDTDRAYDLPRFKDESVAARGFGVRTDILDDPPDSRDRRRDSRLGSLKRQSDDELGHKTDLEREDRRRNRQVPLDDRRQRRESFRRGNDDDIDDGTSAGAGDDKDRPSSRLRDKMTTGLSVAATAVGLAPLVKDGNKTMDNKDEREARRRRSPDSDRERRKDGGTQDRFSSTSERGGKDPDREREQWERERGQVRTRERAERDRDRERDRERDRDRDWIREQGRDRDREQERVREESKDDPPILESRNTKVGEARAAPAAPASDDNDRNKDKGGGDDVDEDYGRRTPRRNRSSMAFNPNDAADLRQLREELASMDMSDQSKERDVKEGGEERREQRTSSTSSVAERAVSSPEEPGSGNSSRDRSRRRYSTESALERAKQVRVVSPPREKGNEKPLKGILKQPSARFPEEANPVREGVAPHREDKKLKEAPPGAKWTKINRRIVNPEALTVGRERFEVRKDFVIVLRVLSSEEIQAYASATQVLRGTLEVLFFFSPKSYS